MVKRVEVFYEGWGEHWHWGTLVDIPGTGGRPAIGFEYSAQARQHGLELAKLVLPLNHGGPPLISGFPAHQHHLPGPVYDALPDGWGMMLMDRLFKKRGLSPARIGALDRLTHVGRTAMGALTFTPVAEEGMPTGEDISIQALAADVGQVLEGEATALLERLVQMGGSPQGARPKALIYRDTATGTFSTADGHGREAWLIKFPARNEHAEVCAIEYVYAECLRRCGIQTPDTHHFTLSGTMAAFGSKRFDRWQGCRIQMQSLAAAVGADYRVPGALDYTGFLRATDRITGHIQHVVKAFERAVFNVAFNNRDDHPKNFSYTLLREGWALSPAYDVTFCEGPGGYHQMDVLGEALAIERQHLLRLATEARLSETQAGRIIDTICQTASQFARIADQVMPGQIRRATLKDIARLIDGNVQRLQSQAPTRHAPHRLKR